VLHELWDYPNPENGAKLTRTLEAASHVEALTPYADLGWQ